MIRDRRANACPDFCRRSPQNQPLSRSDSDIFSSGNFPAGHGYILHECIPARIVFIDKYSCVSTLGGSISLRKPAGATSRDITMGYGDLPHFPEAEVDGWRWTARPTTASRCAHG